MSLKRAWKYARLREAVLSAGEEYCSDPDPHGGVGGVSCICTRPAGHTGKHAAHGCDPDKPLWTWPRGES